MIKNEKFQIVLLSVALILAVVLLIALVAPAFTVAVQLQEEETIQAMEVTDPTEVPWPEVSAAENITNIMLVGHNYRPDEPNYLSDAMILCSINRETKVLTMVSFVRDLMVPLPAYAGHTAGRNRINVCYALGSNWTGDSKGGMEMLALCIEQNFGIPVHHTVEVDFEAFVDVIDHLGGVEVELTEAEAKYMTENIGYVGTMEPGRQKLIGVEALAYARIRGIDNDRNRTGRQRYLLESIINQIRDLGFWEMYGVIGNVLPYIKTDMTSEEIIQYIWEFVPMMQELELDSVTCPIDNEILPGSYWSGMIDLYGMPASVVECDLQLNREYLQEILGLTEG